MPAPYTSLGKEVLHTVDSLPAHYADAITPDAATRMAQALNLLDEVERGEWEPVMPVPDSEDWQDAMRMEAEPLRVGHTIRQENDEYACSCGARWDVHEGEDHP